MATHADEKRTERINIKISPSLKQAAQEAATADGRSLSNFIERMIVEKTSGAEEKRKIYVRPLIEELENWQMTINGMNNPQQRAIFEECKKSILRIIDEQPSVL